MLAVGDLPGDSIRRLTRGDSYTCCLGSESEHRSLSEFCQALQDLLASTGQELTEYSPEELSDLLRGLLKENSGQ